MTVLIVGAGPTGLCAAALLAQQGVACLVVERWHRPWPLPRAVHLDDEAMRVLQQVGVAARLLPLTRRALGMRLLDSRLQVMAQFDRAEPVGQHGWPPANMFDQPDLDRLLRERVGELPLVELRTGVELVGLVEGAATLRVLASGRLEVVATDAVLGCDGAGSTVRRLLGTGWRDLGFEERWLVVDGRCAEPLGTWDGISQVCDPRRAATYMQVGADRYRWELRLHQGEQLSDVPVEGLLEPWLQGREVDLLRQADYTFRARVAERWRDGRVLLLGDAAHETPPFVGQGLGSGLRDAANLSWKLAAVLRGAPEELLDSYQAEREPHVRSLIRLAITVGWAMTGGQDRAAVVRRLVLAGLCRVPGATDHLLDRGSPPLRPGQLVGRRHRPGALTGRLLPQPAPGDDDQLGAGFAVVTTGPLGPALAEVARDLDAREVHADPAVEAWLRRGGASAAVVRPDRVVAAVAGPGGALRSEHAQVCRRLVEARGGKVSGPGARQGDGHDERPGARPWASPSTRTGTSC